MVFLAQFPFWEFEVESLIYVFQTFAERKKDWDESGAVSKKILNQNFIVRKKYLDDFYYRSVGVRKYNPYRWDKGGVVAPVDLLKDVVEEWNKLLDNCQHLLIDKKDAKAYELSGVKIVKNFNQFKKSVSGLVEIAEE